MNRIADSEVLWLAKIAASIRGEYLRDNAAWADSPFSWIRTRPSRQRGKIGEQLVAGWCTARGLDVVKCRDSEADLIIQGHRTEVKFSTIWENGLYVFQQFRDQDYELAICLGISPYDASCWVVPKELVLEHAQPQHTGIGGKETFWLHIPAADPPEWLSACGGTLAQALDVLKGLRRQPPAAGHR